MRREYILRIYSHIYVLFRDTLFFYLSLQFFITQSCSHDAALFQCLFTVLLLNPDASDTLTCVSPSAFSFWTLSIFFCVSRSLSVNPFSSRLSSLRFSAFFLFLTFSLALTTSGIAIVFKFHCK